MRKPVKLISVETKNGANGEYGSKVVTRVVLRTLDATRMPHCSVQQGIPDFSAVALLNSSVPDLYFDTISLIQVKPDTEVELNSQELALFVYLEDPEFIDADDNIVSFDVTNMMSRVDDTIYALFKVSAYMETKWGTKTY